MLKRSDQHSNHTSNHEWRRKALGNPETSEAQRKTSLEIQNNHENSVVFVGIECPISFVYK